MSTPSIQLVLAILTCCAEQSVAERPIQQIDSKNIDLSLTVSLANEPDANGEPVFNMVLRNDSATPIQLQEARLPWTGRDIIVVPVVDIHLGGQVIARVERIDDPANRRVTIMPNKTLSGRLKLGEHYGIHKYLDTDDVIVFWAYTPLRVDLKPSTRLHGIVVIPKKMPSSD